MGTALLVCLVGIAWAVLHSSGGRQAQVAARPDTTEPVQAIRPARASPPRASLTPATLRPPLTSSHQGPRPRPVPRPRSALPSTEAVPLQGGTQGRLHYLSSGGMTRSYLGVQASHPSRRSVPLVVVLHGSHVTPALEEQRTGFDPFAVAGRAVLVYPTGYAESWNAGQRCCGLAEANGLDDVAFVHAVVADAMAHYRIDPHRVYLVGYSNGGKMALRIACSDPAPFAAVATFGAVPLTDCATGTPVPVLLAASTGDAEIPYAVPGPLAINGAQLPSVTQAVSTLVVRNGCSATHHLLDEGHGTVSVSTWSSCGSGKSVQLVTYPRGSHSWPGSTTAVPVPFAAVVAVPVQGLMWQFLSALRH